MKTNLVMLAVIAAMPVAAQEARDVPTLLGTQQQDSWQSDARFFGGVRTGVGIPPGGQGVAPTLGFEMGVSAPHGFGFGLHILGMNNPPGIPQLGVQKAAWGLGALADLRMYFQTVEPLTLYATLSGGFLAGPSETNTNVVLPLINPGFGARVKFNDVMYVSFEFGAAGFFIPFINMSVGWEPQRIARKVQPYAPPPPPGCSPVCPPGTSPTPPPEAPPAAAPSA
ncbi:MAG TPA: hypothetical protein VND93_28510 [Myxococcales bacterium]|nr:hypothetical protein [Myxococcales bacterium]